MKQKNIPQEPLRKPLKLFLLKGLLFFLPVFLLATSFVIADPFRLFKTYADYSENMYVIPNRDFISTQVYLKNNPVQQYNSFIFGSSRTIAYRTNDWSLHLGSNARPFVFDASGESLFGIYTKICYIDRHHGSLKNVLIILDTDCTFAHE
ncbi:MAG: hypothetical protein Q8914_14435, partial [Bacteroidota bacterium]|nr:hypothetical protein [Bacteroidota bacterium]